MKFMITGGAGFIGSAVVRHIINNTDHQIINIDKPTYAGNLDTLNSIDRNKDILLKKLISSVPQRNCKNI